jgi:dimethylaniline monooxygenase (N-oxide forming)
MQDETSVKMPDQAVAVIGGGPAGLVVSRWLLAQGLEPVIFETTARLGGQWNSASASSATWPGMRTNTSRIVTSFSDMDHRSETPNYAQQGGSFLDDDSTFERKADANVGKAIHRSMHLQAKGADS